MGFNFVGPKDIQNILDPKACNDLPGDELATIWKEWHADKEVRTARGVKR